MMTPVLFLAGIFVWNAKQKLHRIFNEEIFQIISTSTIQLNYRGGRRARVKVKCKGCGKLLESHQPTNFVSHLKVILKKVVILSCKFWAMFTHFWSSLELPSKRVQLVSGKCFQHEGRCWSLSNAQY